MSRPTIPLWLVLALSAVVTMAAAAAGLSARATYGAQTTADEPYYLLTAQSLAADGDLDIADELTDRAYTPYHAVTIDPQTTPLDRAGRRLSPHDPLLPLVLAPAMGLGGWQAAKAFLVVIAGFAAALTVWLGVRRMGVGSTPAGVVVTGLFAGMPLAPYGTQVYPELPAALVVLGAVAGISALPVAGTSMPHRLWAVALVCTTVIALPWLSVKYAPIAAVLALLAGLRLWRAGRRRTLLAATAVLALAGIVYLLAHQTLYGGLTVYAAGDHFTETGELSVVGLEPNYLGRSRRIVGLLVDRSFGIATWAPGWLLAPAALALLGLRRHPHRWLILAPVVAGWMTATFVALTMHGWWVPGRQIVVVLPLVAIAIAGVVDRFHRLMVPTLLLLMAGAGNWLWLAVEATTGQRTLVVDAQQTVAPAYRLLAPLMPDGLAGGTRADLLLIAWTIVLGLTVVQTLRTLRSRRADRDPTEPPDTIDVGVPSQQRTNR